MYKIRFNLSKGVDYEKWKVINPDKSVTILDPNKYELLLLNVKFNNEKNVCSWIEAEEIQIQNSIIVNTFEINESQQIKYNPKSSPYWIFKENKFDGVKLDAVLTYKSKLYAL